MTDLAEIVGVYQPRTFELFTPRHIAVCAGIVFLTWVLITSALIVFEGILS